MMRALTPYVPKFTDLFEINKEIDRLFDSFLGKRYDLNGSWSPAADIIEENDKYLIRAELPGVKQEDIKVTLDDNVVTLKGEKRHENESKDKHCHRIERFYGTFSRSFNLPNGIKRDGIGANYKDGVLEISLPKSEEAKPKQIEIAVN